MSVCSLGLTLFSVNWSLPSAFTSLPFRLFAMVLALNVLCYTILIYHSRHVVRGLSAVSIIDNTSHPASSLFTLIKSLKSPSELFFILPQSLIGHISTINNRKYTVANILVTNKLNVHRQHIFSLVLWTRTQVSIHLNCLLASFHY